MFKLLFLGLFIVLITVFTMVNSQDMRIHQLEADLELAQQVTESEDISGCR